MGDSDSSIEILDEEDEPPPPEAASGSVQDFYDTVRVVGSGGFGIVYLVNCKKTGKDFALKKISLEGRKDFKKDKKNVEREIRILKQCDHENIVKFEKYYFDSKKTFHLIIEWCNKGDLSDFIKAQAIEGQSFPVNVIISCSRDIVRGLNYLHHHPIKKILHRDLKPGNILCFDDGTSNGRWKIADFGISKIKGKNIKTILFSVI